MDSVIKPMMAKLQLNEVEMMSILPKQIVHDVIEEMYDQFIEVMPFQTILRKFNHPIFQRVCNELVSSHMPTRSHLWSEGEQASAMHFLLSGKLKYRWHGPSGLTTQFFDQRLEEAPSEALSEIVLWSPWAHVGEMQSVTWTELLLIGHEKFIKCLSSRPSILWLPKAYAHAFVEEMNRLTNEGEVFSDLLRVEKAVDIITGEIHDLRKKFASAGASKTSLALQR